MSGNVLSADVRRMLPRAVGLTVAMHSKRPAVQTGALAGDLISDLTESQLRNLALCLAAYCDPTRILREVLDDPKDSVELTIAAASQRFGVTAAEVLGLGKRQELIDARHVAAYAARLYGMTSVAIGKAMNRDHTTILYGCARVGESPRLRRIAQDIAEAIGWDRNEEVA